MSAFEARGVGVSYGNITAVRGVDVHVETGEAVAILGANGAGKTSLLGALAGLLPHTGSVHIAGSDASRWSCARRWSAGVVLVPEGRAVFPTMTVEEHLRVPPIGKAGPRRQKLIDEAYEMFPRLGERRKQSAGTLSGGEQQMLAIARGLVGQPKVLMLDEPSLGLAPVICDVVFEALGELVARGNTILLVEQNADRALRLASRAYVMERGEVKISGSSEELRTDPRVKAAYLGG